MDGVKENGRVFNGSPEASVTPGSPTGMERKWGQGETESKTAKRQGALLREWNGGEEDDGEGGEESGGDESEGVN
jgi:hypothetical protein